MDGSYRIEWKDRAAEKSIRQRAQIARARAGRTDPPHPRGDGIVSAAMSDGGFHGDDGKLSRLDALAAPLAEIEWRRLAAREQNRKPAVARDRASSHVEAVPCH